MMTQNAAVLIEVSTNNQPNYLSTYPQAIFNKHDAKGRGFLSLAQLRHLLKDVGLNVETKDLKLLFGRIDHDATNSVSR